MTDRAPEMSGLRWGHLSMALGALALAIAVTHIFGGPFGPQRSVGTVVGEIAGEMRAAALRAVRGAPQPAPEPLGWTIDRILALGAPLLGVVAIVTSAISALARDPWRLPTYGAVLGTSAIVFQMIWWLALLFACVALLVAIIENVGDILGS